MKTNRKRIWALILAAVVALGSCAGYLIATRMNNNNETLVYADEGFSSVSANDVSGNDEKTEKFDTNDEVVYVFADSNGNVNKVMDSVRISNGDSSAKTGDDSSLPIDVTISYKLDNKPIDAKALAGKSGHLTMRLDFKDLIYEEREVNGAKEKVYVPFIASSVVILDGDNYENVEVSTGKVAYDGQRYAVVGLAITGLKDDLDLDPEDDIDIPEYIEIEADVKDCEITGMYLLVSNSVFNELDIDTTEKMDSLKEDISKISDAMDALMDGSDQIYDGLNTLLSGATKLSDGVSALSDGLGTLDSNSQALVDGAKQVFETLLATASQQMKDSGISVGNLAIDNYAEILYNVVDYGCAMDPARAGVAAEVEKNNDAIVAQVTAGVKEMLVKKAVADGIQANPTAMAQIAQAIADGINAQTGASLTYADILTAAASEDPTVLPLVTEAVSTTADNLIAANDPSVDAARTGVDAYMASNPPEITAAIDAKVAEIKNGLIDANVGTIYNEANAKILELRSSLMEYEKFYNGIIAYTNGVGSAYSGSLELVNAMPELLSGIKTLRDGSGELSDGLETFNDEAISKVTDLVDDTLEGLVNRFNIVSEVSKNYNAYDVDGEPTKDGVKFIYKIDSIR